MKITLSNISYLPNEELIIDLDFRDSKDLLNGLSNININIFRIDVKRNSFVFGFGHAPENKDGIISIRRSLPDSFVEGAYLIHGIKLIYSDETRKEIILASGRDIPNLFFWVAKTKNDLLTKNELDDTLKNLSTERAAFENRIIITDAAGKAGDIKNYVVFIFSVGCLVHHSQIMEGYTISPLRKGYDYDHMHESVNDYLEKVHGIKIPYEKSIADSFAQSTPLFVITFQNVRAIDNADAAIYCSMMAEYLFTILSYEKGQRPKQYATIVLSPSENMLWQSFHFPGYGGNLVSDFSPSSTAEYIEKLFPLMQKSPWLELLMRSLADAVSEDNPSVAFLKFWSILELVAKRRIANNKEAVVFPDGSQIFYEPGKPVTTAKSLGKVYSLLFKINLPPFVVNLGNHKLIFETYQDASENPNLDEETVVIPLWDVVRAAYEIRNSTAHSGVFDPRRAEIGSAREQLAACMYQLPHFHFLDHIKQLTRFTVSNELNFREHDH
jgi:hypothetical protein